MSTDALLGSGQQSFDQMHEGRRYYGAYVGKVTDNKNPDDQYCVKVNLPSIHIDGEHATYWARVANIMAGNEMGSFWLPEVGDEVLVVFANGDDQQPIVIGSLWNGVDKVVPDIDVTPDDVNVGVSNNAQGGKNDYRFFHSRCGHTMVFCDKGGEEFITLRTNGKHELTLTDKGGAEKIQLYDKDRKQWLEIDVPGKKITVQTDTGEMLIKAKTLIKMECEDLDIYASKTIKVESGTSTEWKAGSTIKYESGGTTDHEAGGTMTLKAPKIDLNP